LALNMASTSSSSKGAPASALPHRQPPSARRRPRTTATAARCTAAMAGRYTR
jgi:hypothetical protein